MSFNLLFILSILIFLNVTIIVFRLLNRFFKWLAEKLESIIPAKVAPEIPVGRSRKTILSGLNHVLVLCLVLFTLAISLEGTIFKADFVVDEIQKLDVNAVASGMLNQQSTNQLLDTLEKLFPAKVSAAADQLADQVPGQLPDKVTQLASEQVYAAASVQATLAVFEPALREQLVDAIYSVYDYFDGKKIDPGVDIPLKDLRDALRANLEKAVLSSPPAELAKASPEQVQSYIDSLYKAQFGHVPAEMTVSLKTASSYVAAPLKLMRFASINLPAFRMLMLALIAISMAGIILLSKNLKTALWTLGLTLVISIMVDYMYAMVAKLASTHTDALMFLPSINLWLIDLLADVVAYIKEPVLLLLDIGVAMLFLALVLAVFDKPKKPVSVKSVSE